MTRRTFQPGIAVAALLTLAGAARADELPRPDSGPAAPSSFSLRDDPPTTLHLHGFSQFRYIANFRDDPPSTTSRDSGFTNGFEVARTRLAATGELEGGDVSYTIEAEFLPNGESLFFLNAYAQARIDSRHTLQAGQFRLPLWREWSVSESQQLAVNASLMTEGLNPGYTQGLALLYTEEQFRYNVSFNDGIRAASTPYDSPNEADYAFSGRFEFKGSNGDWALFDDFTGWRNQPKAWLAGLGVIYHHGGGTASTSSPTQQMFLVVAADLSFEGPGWNAYLAGILAHVGPDTTDDELTDFGAVAHAGRFVSEAVEVFGRWDGLFPDSARGGNTTTAMNTVTAGANWYLFPKSHAAKITADVQWFVNPSLNNGIVRPIIDASNAVIRADSQGDQFTLRFQFQFVF